MLRYLLLTLFVCSAAVQAQVGGGGVGGIPKDWDFTSLTTESLDVNAGADNTFLNITSTSAVLAPYLQFNSNSAVTGWVYYDPNTVSMVIERAGGLGRLIIGNSVVNAASGNLQQGGVNACLQDGTNCPSNITSGSFSFHMLGCTDTTQTGTMNWYKVGRLVTLHATGVSGTCTSNATTYAIDATNMPAALDTVVSTGTANCFVRNVWDNDGGTFLASASTSPGVGRISGDFIDIFWAGSASGFTASNRKDFTGFSCTYIAAS